MKTSSAVGAARKTYPETDLLPISALQHLLFCERQCALIHIEQAWEENRLTAEGRILHERVDSRENESRGGVRIARDVWLRSLRLGLVGIADVVEFHCMGGGATIPFPVEYKRGRPKKDQSDEVQLCAQALCLEEMLGTTVPEGALFYGKTRRRAGVAFNPTLRAMVEAAAVRLHDLIEKGRTPIAPYEKKCDRCSLYGLCRPKTIGRRVSVRGYLDRMLEV